LPTAFALTNLHSFATAHSPKNGPTMDQAPQPVSTPGNPAWRLKHTVMARASVEFAWAFWTTVENWAAVDDGIESVRIDDAHGFRAGVTGTTVTVPGSSEVHWYISEAQEPQSARIQFVAPDVSLESRWTFDALGNDTCAIGQEMVLYGPGAASIQDEVAEGMGAGLPAGMSSLALAIEAAFQSHSSSDGA
jgi:hypothetical protein